MSATALEIEEQAYYQRQMVLPEWGEAGQLRLKAARVLVVGAGGLGAPVLQYLGAAGVGLIGVADGDFVEVSNLHRQVIHTMDDLDMPKTASAAARLRRGNPHIEVVEHMFPVTEANAADLVAGYDIVADCTDNFATRDVLHAACFALGRTLVSGAAQMTEGTVTTFAAFRGGANPCFRCLYPSPLPPEVTPTCSMVGVAGPVLTVIGGLQAMEVVKEILGVGDGLSGRIVLYDGLSAGFSEIPLARRAGCPCCGGAAPVPDEGAMAQPPVTGG
ncbi:HesA/MoeB/ThiF family protein [Stappia stellulata]|uniref:HesA/MoeB/ThiF family protein n=1 Tax=Stappia stellulata TaxID=71235 RepID=UPI001CD3A93F|nr:HesA/MoeB/ThiF family protein [Stappia stellulata]MCA1243295.1 HesA/MoeB/ThiF family protein [Stappia stellulata]